MLLSYIELDMFKLVYSTKCIYIFVLNSKSNLNISYDYAHLKANSELHSKDTAVLRSKVCPINVLRFFLFMFLTLLIYFFFSFATPFEFQLPRSYPPFKVSLLDCVLICIFLMLFSNFSNQSCW